MRLGRLVLYVQDVEATIGFYESILASRRAADGDRIVELVASKRRQPDDPSGRQGPEDGAGLVKLVFDVEDVEAFCAAAGQRPEFGPIHWRRLSVRQCQGSQRQFHLGIEPRFQK